jgi:hypothetical protein
MLRLPGGRGALGEAQGGVAARVRAESRSRVALRCALSRASMLSLASIRMTRSAPRSSQSAFTSWQCRRSASVIPTDFRRRRTSGAVMGRDAWASSRLLTASAAAASRLAPWR